MPFFGPDTDPVVEPSQGGFVGPDTDPVLGESGGFVGPDTDPVVEPFVGPDLPAQASSSEIMARIKSDPEFQPTQEQLAQIYGDRYKLAAAGLASGLKNYATQVIPTLAKNAFTNTGEQVDIPGVAPFWKVSSTLLEGLAQGSAQAGTPLRRFLEGVVEERIANAAGDPLRAIAQSIVPVLPRSPEQIEQAQQMYLERVRRNAAEDRLMEKYYMGEQALLPGAAPGAAAVIGNIVDPTIAIPALSAAGKLSRAASTGSRAASTGSRVADVAAEAASKGGIARSVAGATAPVVEGAAQAAGRGSAALKTAVDAVQPVADVVGGVTGGFTGLAGTHAVGRAASHALKWASKVRDSGTALRHVATADWRSAQPIYAQLAKSPDAPVWLRRASSSAIAPAVESTLRGAAGTVRGAAEGAGIGALFALDDTLSPEERAGVLAVGGAIGAGAGAAGRLLSIKSRAEARQAHDIAVRMHRAIQNGADPAVVLGASDAVMFYADNIEKIFQGTMPSGRDLKVDLVDARQYAELGQPGVAFFEPGGPDGNPRVVVNIEQAGADSRILHEAVGHALAESVVGGQPQMLAAVRSAVDRVSGGTAQNLLQAASEQYAKALHPNATPEQLAAYIQQKRLESARMYGDSDAWILSELWAESAVRAVGGRSLLDLASPGFFGRVARKLFGKDEAPKKFDVKENTFFGPYIEQVLNDPVLHQTARRGLQDAQAYRAGIDKPVERGVRIDPKMIGKIREATLHDLGGGRKGNDFVEATPDGRVVARPPSQVRKIVRNRRAYINRAVPMTDPVSAYDTDPYVKYRYSVGGRLAARTGRKLGQWFYGSQGIFSETTKQLAKRLEEAIEKGETLGAWYHQVGESSPNWRKSVERDFGNIEAEYKDFIPFEFQISRPGNLLVRVLSVTALERKAQQWSARRGPASLELWNGDVGAFRQDLQTYLKNHAEGRPGAEGLGEQKRDVINAFLVGDHKGFQTSNELRHQLRGEDKMGVIRSYRLDRLEPVQESDAVGFSKPDYSKQVHNISPAVSDNEVHRTVTGRSYSPAVEAKVERQRNPEVARVADEYAKAAGIRYRPFTDYLPVNEDLARQLADALEAAEHAPDDPAVAAAYKALADETIAQWKAIEASGVRMEPWRQGGEPYASSADMMKDVRENKHLWFFPTTEGFGSGGVDGPAADVHPLIADSGIKSADGQRLLVNDIFRAVHDYFGHAKEGYQFGPRGEYNAYLAHSRMYSDAALPALASETLAQNSWVNYGRHLRRSDGTIPKAGEEGYIPPQQRPFANQKATLLPPELVAAATPGRGDVQASPDIPETPDLTNRPEEGNLRSSNEQEDLNSKGGALSLQGPQRWGSTPLEERVRSGIEAQRFASDWDPSPNVADDSGYPSDLALVEDIERQEANLRRLALENSFMLRPGDLDRISVPAPTSFAGHEHAVRFSTDGSRVIKVNHPGKYALQRWTPSLYLKDLAALNRIFPFLDIRVIGVVDFGPKGLGIVTSHKRIFGRKPTSSELDAALRKQGWEPNETGWVHKDTGTVIEDVHTGNLLLQDDGRVVPIDVHVRLPEGNAPEGLFHSSDRPGRGDVQASGARRANPRAARKTPARRGRGDVQASPAVPDIPDGIRNAQTESPEFKRWFGNWENPHAFSSKNKEGPVSVVVGKDGAPLPVYHSTRGDFTKFETGREGFNNYGFLGNVPVQRWAIFFSDSPTQADAYSKTEGQFEDGSRTVPVFLDIKSPIDFRDYGFDLEGLAQELGLNYRDLLYKKPWELLDGDVGKEFVEAAKKAGYDGVIFNEDILDDSAVPGTTTYAVFDPSQIKSAIGNRGTFDPNDPDIRHSPEIPLTEAVKQVPPEHRPAIRAAARRISQVKKENPEAVPLSVVRDRKTGLPKIDVLKDADGEPILDEKGNPKFGVVFAVEPYNLRKAPGLSTDDAKAVQQAAEKMVPDVKEALKNPEIAAGLGWYSKMRRQLQKAFGADIELFGQLLGATSARTSVVENFNQTLDAIRQLSKGAYDGLLKRYHEHIQQVHKDAESGVLYAKWKEANPGKTPGQFDLNAEVRKAINKFPEIPLRSNGKKFNANSAKVLQALYGNWLEQTVGPKTPNFAGNLTGRTLEATIDVWAARYLRRLLYSDKVKRWRILPEQEGGVDFTVSKSGKKGGDFFFAQDVFREVSERTGIAPDDLQALMWFAEKAYWRERGWTKGAGEELSSFEGQMEKLATDRYQAGVTTYLNEETFDPVKHDATIKALRQRIAANPDVVSARVVRSVGLYGGEIEPSIDIEFTVKTGANVDRALDGVLAIGRRFNQTDTFFSQVVDDDHPNARPMFEIGFKEPVSDAELMAVVDIINAHGIDGLTVARDRRGRIIGVRAQYIPEITGRYVPEHLDIDLIDQHLRTWALNANKALEKIKSNPNISYAKKGSISTHVVGREEARARPIRTNSIRDGLERRKRILGRAEESDLRADLTDPKEGGSQRENG